MKNYECPDCGRSFREGFVPETCTGCGCSSAKFVVSEEKPQNESNSQSGADGLKIVMAIILVAVIVIGGFTYYNYNNKKVKEQARYEQEEKAYRQRESQREKQREREEREERRYSTQWKDFAGTSYRATQFYSSDVCNNFAFSYSSSGRGTYVLFGTIPGTHVVTDQMEFNIYKVTSDRDHIYLHCSELNTPVKILIKGHSLYTNDGSERYERWQ